ncbi:glycosyltransferase family 25 protein [Hypoxylon crocopeplum]|nr:glycosyltransferase family 25 protein [Hypoxylon crocopeplum]
MSPYRRVFAALLVITPILYIYWRKFTVPEALIGFRGHAATEDVFNNTLGFSKIFVINLPSRTDRRDRMSLAGAVSNLSFTWIDGVPGDQVSDQIVPGGAKGHSVGAKGSWRSHMNALQAVVGENLESALIMEDDVDWDVRLKSQLQTFASASRGWLRESRSDKKQPDLLNFAPPSPFGRRDSAATGVEESERNTIQLSAVTRTDGDTQNVFGDGWDVLWLGHCGADLPDEQSQVSPLKITIPDDETVPAPKHLKPHPFSLPDKLGDVYPPHTRVVHASSGNVCSLAYAVSKQGARKLLWEFSVKFDSQWDLMLQKWCEGGYVAKEGDSQTSHDRDGDEDIHYPRRNDTPVCLTVQPPLISHHYPKGSASDIQGEGGGYAKGIGTPYIRLSVQENLQHLIVGALEGEMVDQLPDNGKTIWK